VLHPQLGVGGGHQGAHAPTVSPAGVHTVRRYGAAVAHPALVIFDADGEELAFDPAEATSLFGLTGDLDEATVSACPRCRSRVVAVVALADLIADAPPLARSGELLALADDAPTLHLYVRDLQAQCSHRPWLDPGAEEWAEVVAELAGPSILR
jgi:hypothetical protein